MRSTRVVPGVQVLILSASADTPAAHAAFRLEIAGYLLKAEFPEALVPAIRTVARGGRWYSPHVRAERGQNPGALPQEG